MDQAQCTWTVGGPTTAPLEKQRCCQQWLHRLPAIALSRAYGWDLVVDVQQRLESGMWK